MGDEFTLEDALIILRRRLLHFIIPVIVLAPLGILVVMLLPPQYAAQGTILVESAQIPSEMVRSTINAYAQERIQMIRQRVMTRNRLLEIADKYEVFPKESGLSESDRVQRMRDRVKVSLITTDATRSTAQRDNTIAFNVTYADGSPDRAFKVANEIMSQFLTEDVRTRTAGASNTTEFFKQEVQRLSTAVDDIEKRIADYKAENAGALPDHLDMHLDMLEQATRDLTSNDAAQAALDEEIRFLETQLTSYFAGATSEDGPAQKLASLKSELARLRAVYHDAHPNVQAVKDEMRALEGALAPSREIRDLQTKLAETEKALKAGEAAETPDAALIEAKRAEVTSLQEQLSQRIAQETSSGGGDFLSAQLQGRIALANSRRGILETQREDIKKNIADLQMRIARTPEVERGLQALTRNYENLFKEYQDVVAKQQEAQLAENLEDDQKAEKFSILEAAMRPEKPTSPERVKLSVLAVLASLAIGALIAVAAEFLAATVRGRAHLEKLIEGHPIAVIPLFGEDGATAVKRRLFGLRAAPAAAAASAAAIAAAGVIESEARGPEDFGGAPRQNVDL
jgi:uncharacterized protein involved in exopolysaccharide biosynthesis